MGSVTLKVENLHYELTEDDVMVYKPLIHIQAIFNRTEPISVKLTFDRNGRRDGNALVRFKSVSDANEALEKVDLSTNQ